MAINPVAPVQWSGSNSETLVQRNPFTKHESTKFAETERPVDAASASLPVSAEAPEQQRAAPPSMLQLKIEEMLNEQAETLKDQV